MNLFNISGHSELEQIERTSDITLEKKHKGGFGGHLVETRLDDLIAYWKELGINVTVK